MKISGIKTNTRCLLVACAILPLAACDDYAANGGGTENGAEARQSIETTPSPTARSELSDQREEAAPVSAVAILSPTQGNDAEGRVEISAASPEGLALHVRLSGLHPGKHGFHVHTLGDCSAPDASSAGGHFNPTGMPHSGPDSVKHHVGDLGNLEADDNGQVDTRLVFESLRLQGETGILGRALIVHQNADDFETQPSGDAGPRVACGVIEKAGNSSS